MSSLVAANDLRLDLSQPDAARIAWGEPDWLGPIGLAVRGKPLPSDGMPSAFEGEDAFGAYSGAELQWRDLPWPVATRVRAYRDTPLLVFRIEALADCEDLGSGRLDQPALAWPWFRPGARARGGIPDGTRGFGHQFTEFAMPSLADSELRGFLRLGFRPDAFTPLWLNAPDGRSLLLAPLDAFHDQLIAVPPDDDAQAGVGCGWHGDLARAPRGFASELAVWAGAGPRAVVEAWAGALRARYGTRRASRYVDALHGKLSYWTDNGATYWYRTEPGHDVEETLVAVADRLREDSVPVDAVELDSWFYPHQVARAVTSESPSFVPPTGMLRWQPREDVLPRGIEHLRTALGNPPLVLHARHYAAASPYTEAFDCWIDGDRAHPKDDAFFDMLLSHAAAWGAVTVEQDWLVELWLGVRGLREEPGRVRRWHEQLDRAAGEHGLSLLWCMATGPDFLQTLTLERVHSIRTSGDYRYLAPNAQGWVRFLYTNALARALRLQPFKDVFLSDPEGDARDGDPHAEAEALLAALSSGPVGIGDRLGRTRREIVMRTCRSDGVLLKPDLPIAAIDRCLRRDCFFEPEPLVGETWNDHAVGRWSYIAAFNAWQGREPLALDLPLAALGDAAPREPAVAYDWRSRETRELVPGDALRAELAPDAWRLWVLCPVLAGGLAIIGDPERYASAADRRVSHVEARQGSERVRVDLVGAPDEALALEGWARAPLSGARLWTAAAGWQSLPLLAGSGSDVDGAARWRVELALDSGGSSRVELRL